MKYGSKGKSNLQFSYSMSMNTDPTSEGFQSIKLLCSFQIFLLQLLCQDILL